jgi:hypothetical protein
MESRHHHGRPGLPEAAGLGAGEAGCFTGADGTQAVAFTTFGLLQDAVVPDKERLRAFGEQRLEASGGLLPEKVGQESGVPLVGAQEVGETLGTGGRAVWGEQLGAQFGEQEGVGAMAEAEKELDGGVEGADEASVDAGIEALEEGSQKGVQLLAQMQGNPVGGWFALGQSGSIIRHGSDLRLARRV